MPIEQKLFVIPLEKYEDLVELLRHSPHREILDLRKVMCYIN